jgi:hypothetical protein
MFAQVIYDVLWVMRHLKEIVSIHQYVFIAMSATWLCFWSHINIKNVSKTTFEAEFTQHRCHVILLPCPSAMESFQAVYNLHWSTKTLLVANSGPAVL